MVEGVDADDEETRREPPGRADRRRRQGDLLLGDVAVGLARDAVGEPVALALGQAAAERPLAPHAGVGGLDDEFVEAVEHVLAGRRVAAPPRGHRRQLQFGVEQAAAQRRQERHQRRRLRDAAAEGVGDGDGAAPHRLDEAGHAAHRSAPELEGVARLRRLAAQDQVDRLQTPQGLDVDAVVADGQVGALDQRVAHVAGEERVLEVVLRGGPRGQDNDAGVLAVPRRVRGQRELAGLEGGGEAPRLGRHQQVGQHPVNDDAVFEGEAEPVGGLGAVAEHPPASVRRAHEVGRVEMQPAPARRFEPVAAAQEGGVRVQPLRRQRALGDQAPRAVEVAEHRVEQPRALGDRLLKLRPFGPVDDARHQVEGPVALPGAALAVHVERHAVVADEPARLLRPAGNLVPAGRGEGPRHRPPMRPEGPVGTHHLVVVAREGGVAGRRHRHAGSVAGAAGAAQVEGVRDGGVRHRHAGSVAGAAGAARRGAAQVEGVWGGGVRHRHASSAVGAAGAARRRSRVCGAAGFASGGPGSKGPGVWPNGRNRAARRASASAALTGNVS